MSRGGPSCGPGCGCETAERKEIGEKRGQGVRGKFVGIGSTRKLVGPKLQGVEASCLSNLTLLRLLRERSRSRDLLRLSLPIQWYLEEERHGWREEVGIPIYA